MTRYASFIALAAFLTFGFGTVASFASEPAPAEQKEKKDASGTKADGEKKDEKKDMGTRADGDKKDEKKEMGGK